MPSQSHLSSALWVGAGALLASTFVFSTADLQAQALDLSVLDQPAVTGPMPSDAAQAPEALQLEISVNGEPMGFVAEVFREHDGTLSMDSTQLFNVGILPVSSARQPDGRINLSKLPNVTYQADDLGQTLHFQAGEAQRAPKMVSAKAGVDPVDLADPRNQVQSGFGALMNYTLNANSLYGFEHSKFYSNGVSGTLEGRLFSPAGVVEGSTWFSNDEFRRLDTSWSYSNPQTMQTFRVGDLITSGLSWTRPTRLAGIQFHKNFALRPGLITMPVPGFTGSAAVPSTVDVFLNNARRFSSDIASGPFEVIDMPVVTGPGTARVVVRDEHGNETVTESAFFVSDRLLRPGYLDYSFEAGFPRLGFGTAHDRYDDRLFASTSLRYGISDWLTWEGHAEGGEDLLNGGMSFVSGLGSWGVGSLAVSGSSSQGDQGVQVTGSLEVALGDLRLQGRLQQTLGDYSDISSLTFKETRRDGRIPGWGAPAKAMQQVSASMPVLDFGYLNLSYTHREDIWGRDESLVGASYGQPLFGGTFTASGFTDVESDNWGVFASLSFPIGDHRTASTTARSDEDGLGAVASITQSPHDDNGKFGWQLQYEQSDEPKFAARGDVETPISTVGGSLRQSGDATWGTARLSGSVVAAGGGVFLSNRIDDAFAVVDAGSSGIPVLYENRPAGVTGTNGMVLIPDLRAYERNTVGIDPMNMPLDAAVASTRQVVVPADRSGVVVSFAGAPDSGTALVIFKDEAGADIQVGSAVQRTGAQYPSFVGYDGQAYLTGLQSRNRVTIAKANGGSCDAEFYYAPDAGNQVTILDVPCIPKAGEGL